MKKAQLGLSDFKPTEVTNRLIETKEESVELIDIPGYNTIVATFYYQIGQVGEGHCHKQPRIVFIRSGRIRVTIDENTFEVTPGDFFFLLPETSHSFEVIGEKAPKLVEVILFQSSDEWENWMRHTPLKEFLN